MLGVVLRSRRATIVSMVVTLATIFVAQATAQSLSSSSLMLEVRPGYELPLGGSLQYFSGGGSLDVTLAHPVRSSSFYLLGGAEYSYLGTSVATSVSVAAARLGGGVSFRIGKDLDLFGYGAGGYYYSTLNDFSAQAADPYLGAGAGVALSFTPAFGIDLAAQYNSYFGLYGGLSFGVGSTIALSRRAAKPASVPIPTTTPRPQPLSSPAPAPPPSEALRISGINLKPVFPVFYSYYADHPIGNLVIKNVSTAPVSNITVDLNNQEYMNNPSEANLPGKLAAGATKRVRLDALFSQKLLTVTEGTKSSANVSVSFQVNGKSYTTHRVVVLDFLGRNGMTWDDTRKAAAFVTAQNPNVLAIARSIASSAANREKRPIPENLVVAIALHDALDLYGMNYVPSSKTPYSRVSNEPNVIDYLQFPEETLQYKSGDCSDLSILYSALFESVGNRTAFITIPGHIFLAFDSGLTPAQAKSDLIPADLLIERGGTVWIPLETTSIHGGFLKAWKLGANEWYQNETLKQAGFYPIEKAWKIYQPVGLPGTPPAITVPKVSQVYASYLKDVQGYIDLTIQPKMAALEQKVKNGGGTNDSNKLGVLYAKWGKSVLAEREFKSILAKKDYLPAILNLGNIYYLKGDWSKALDYYRKAVNIDPSNPIAILQIAKANVELENFGTAKKSYAQLQRLDPQLAERFSYIGMGPAAATTRSADVASERTTVVWDVP